jgi:DNA-binding response OmpR family regulator
MPNTNAVPARVLVVDDDPDIACTIADGLELDGYRTYVAHDAYGALRLTEGFAPDVALLDIGLPDLDGCELAARLRARHGKQLIMIAVTAYGDDEHRAKAAAAGVHEYFVKPVSLRMLREAIGRLVDAPRREPDDAGPHVHAH